MNFRATRVLLGCAILAAAAHAQTTPPAQAPAKPAMRATSGTAKGVVQGTVTDDTGGVIPKATVTLTDGDGKTQTVQTLGDGTYKFTGVADGVYTVSADFPGLAQNGVVAVQVAGTKPAQGNVVMKVQAQKQEVTVAAESTTQLSVDPAQNVGALVLKKEDLDALPDDPDDLQQDLQALAGPAAGPGGGQIYIDGFTGGRLPPKESIREIRINQNPFSAEFDTIGFGRIEILTKPGSDKFHGQALYSISDDIWNARNPFLLTSPPFRTQLFNTNVSGPISKKASFFIDFERRWIDDNGIINALVPAPTYPFTISPLQEFYPTPQRRTTVSPRIDYQLNTNNTLSVRYGYLENLSELSGIGQYTLPDAGYRNVERQQTGTVTETAILSPKVVNETRFQFQNDRTNQDTLSQEPALNVATAFTTGGSNVGNSYNILNSYEIQNFTSLALGKHSSKVGFRLRGSTIDNRSENGFLPTYSYNGDQSAPVLDANLNPTGAFAALSPSAQYQRFLLLQNAGASPATILADGAGASQLSLISGQPYLGLNQWDWGVYWQDDWRVKPNFTVSLGLRYEGQTNISDKNDWAPRAAFAWSPGGGGNGRPKTVIRGGFGIFYSRFLNTNVLQTMRFNGENQTAYLVTNPTFLYPTIPTIDELTATNSYQEYQIDKNLRAPYLIQSTMTVERQLAKSTTLSLTYTNSRGVHQLRERDINAPNPYADDANLYGPAGLQLFNYESTGFMRQNQFIANVNSRIGSWFSLFGYYSYNDARSDTDGINTIPLNQWNFAGEYSRSAYDIRNRLFVGGSISKPKWNIRLSPFITARSGIPFNIVSGTVDPTTGLLTQRPAFAEGPGEGIVYGPGYGYLDPVPGEGSTIIPRNYGNGPAQFSVNLRLSKTWGFGTTKFAGAVGGSRAGGGGGGFRGGPMGMGGGRGGPFGGESTEHRYNLTLSVNARNVLNHTNLNAPIGSVISSRFLESTGITGGFGAESTSSENRRIDFQLRFAF
jgi:hypothetical protein